MDAREEQLYRSTYQQIVPEEEFVERLLQMENNIDTRGKRTVKMMKKFQMIAACFLCFCVIAGGTVYASQKGYFERIKGNTIIGEMLKTDNEKISEKVKEDTNVDETQIVSDGTYTFQLVSYYKEETMGNIFLEIMITRNDGKTITEKEAEEEFSGDKWLTIHLYGEGQDTLGYGGERAVEYDENNNLIYSFCASVDISEKSKKAENVKKIEIEQFIDEGKIDEEGGHCVESKNIGTMYLVQNPVILDTVELETSNNPEASKLVMSAMGLQLTTTKNDTTRYYGTRIYKKDGTETDFGTGTTQEYSLDNDNLLYIETFGKFLDLETIDYIEIGGVKYEMSKNLNTSEKD